METQSPSVLQSLTIAMSCQSRLRSHASPVSAKVAHQLSWTGRSLRFRPPGHDDDDGDDVRHGIIDLAPHRSVAGLAGRPAGRAPFQRDCDIDWTESNESCENTTQNDVASLARYDDPGDPVRVRERQMIASFLAAMIKLDRQLVVVLTWKVGDGSQKRFSSETSTVVGAIEFHACIHQ
uniref:Uncharacterized protein n=1 Tax=Oryza sativa subsp. japonica TaxID=39947 RepID=Q6H4P4_ORYSJ|nr:hypothetical protein [Oryza sativa Japonica Group]